MTESDKAKILEMYNPECKLNYFNYLESNAKKIDRTLYYLSTYSNLFEKPHNRNLFDIKLGEYQVILPKLEHILLNDYRKDISHINSFIKWAESNGYSEPTPISLADGIELKLLDMQETMRQRVLKDGDHLISYLEQSQILIDIKNVTNPIVVCLLVWLGFQPSELVQLKNEEVDINGKIIITETKRIDIPDDFNIILSSYKNSNSYTVRGKHRGYEIYKIESPYFMKNLSTKEYSNTGEPYSMKALWKTLHDMNAVISSTYGNVYSTDSIWHSGEFYRYYVKKQQGADWDFEDEIRSRNPKWSYTQVLDYVYTFEQYCKYRRN